jgi:hypothetical protein
MIKSIGRTLAVCLTLVALTTPAALASPTGTDPEPGVVHVILAMLGLT